MNNTSRRNRTQFVVTHIFIVCWAVTLLAPPILFLIPMCTPSSFLTCSGYYAGIVVFVLLSIFVMNCRGRLHDKGTSGFYLVFIFFPFSKVKRLLWAEGDLEANRFGKPSDYEKPPLSYFGRVLVLQLVAFALVSIICLMVPPLLTFVHDTPQNITHSATAEEINEVYTKLQTARQNHEPCTLTVSEINALFCKDESVAKQIRLNSMHAGVITPMEIRFDIDVHYPFSLLSQHYFSARMTLKLYQRPAFLYVLDVKGVDEVESCGWVDDYLQNYLNKNIPEWQQLQELLQVATLNFDWDNKTLIVKFDK